jgi:hypothetical protein
VGELRKPPLSAWAVNRLLAEEPRAMAALVGTGERARATQRKVMAGGDAAALRQAIASARTEVERLIGRGVAILTAAERAPGEAIVERLRTNLEALAFDPAAAPAAERGWLDDDLEPPGFEILMGLQLAAASGRPAPRPAAQPAPRPAKQPAPQPPRPAPRGAPAPPSERKPATVHRFEDGRRAAAARAAAERQQRLERARAEVAAAEAEAAVRRREAEREEKAAEQEERRATDSRRRADEAERRAQQDRERAEAARRAAVEARDRARRAEEAAGKAREELAGAEKG